MGFIRWLKSLFSSLWQAFLNFADKVTDIALKEGAHYILDVARVAVKEMSQSNLENEQKRKEAFRRIKEYATSEGLKVPDRIINKVIEDCVLELKAIEF